MNSITNFFKKEDKRSIDWHKLLITCVIIFSLLTLIIHNIYKSKRLETERKLYSKYTVGKVFKTTSPRSGHCWVYCEFFYLGKRYEVSDPWPGNRFNLPNVETYYYIEFSSQNPENAEVLFKKRFDFERLKGIPDSGWNEMQ